VTIRAGVAVFPDVGVAPGELMLAGYAIDAAALTSPYNVSFLFALTYPDAALSGLGNYATFMAPFDGSWLSRQGDPQSFKSWG